MSAGTALRTADERITRVLRALPHHPVGDRVLRGLSRATDRGGGWFAVTLAGMLVDRRNRPTWTRALATLAATEAAGVAVKRRVPRARPDLPGLPPLATTPSPRSFPSTHTANAVAAAVALRSVLPAPGLWALAATTAFSRPYLGVHYASDVVAGALLGAAVASRTRGMSRRP